MFPSVSLCNKEYVQLFISSDKSCTSYSRIKVNIPKISVLGRNQLVAVQQKSHWLQKRVTSVQLLPLKHPLRCSVPVWSEHTHIHTHTQSCDILKLLCDFNCILFNSLSTAPFAGRVLLVPPRLYWIDY